MNIEKWVKKLIFLQLVFLIIAQLLLEIDSFKPYLNKSILYEGVTKHQQVKSMQTIDQMK